MAEFKHKFTQAWEENSPTYRYDEDNEMLYFKVFSKIRDCYIYTPCEDRLSQHGVWLIDSVD